MAVTKHDAARDHIADCYNLLPPLDCLLCGRTVAPPLAANAVTEWRGDGWRADVAALGVDGEPVAIVEVIDAHPPTARVLESQENLPAAFYVETDALANDRFAGWCSVDCWRMQSEMDALAKQDRGLGDDWLEWNLVGKHAANYNHTPIESCIGCQIEIWPGMRRLREWENPYEVYCLSCAADTGIARWYAPGEQATGAAMELPPISGDPFDIFRAWSDAAFWAMIWRKRTEKPQTPRRAPLDDGETPARMNEVESAFAVGDWARGARLLYPVGNSWLQDCDKPRLWAWEPDNCRRVAKAWAILRDCLLDALLAETAARADAARRRRESEEWAND